jgi:hypothetical protein
MILSWRLRWKEMVQRELCNPSVSPPRLGKFLPFHPFCIDWLHWTQMTRVAFDTGWFATKTAGRISIYVAKRSRCFLMDCGGIPRIYTIVHTHIYIYIHIYIYTYIYIQTWMYWTLISRILSSNASFRLGVRSESWNEMPGWLSWRFEAFYIEISWCWPWVSGGWGAIHTQRPLRSCGFRKKRGYPQFSISRWIFHDKLIINIQLL